MPGSTRLIAVSAALCWPATIFTPRQRAMARRPGSLGKDPPGAPLISLIPAPPIQGQHCWPGQKQHRSTSQ
jgi:hypothetical protein